MSKNAKKTISKMIKIILLFAIIFSIGIIRNNNDNKSKTVPSSTQKLSNNKIGWGIKRAQNHEQPELGTTNLKLLSENNGIAIGNKQDKYIYLTFDQGYEAGYTEQILDALKENSVTATFFITAHYVNTEPDLVKRMIDEGNIVGNHTVNHKSMPDLSQEQITSEIMDLHLAIYEKFQYEMKYMRPPMGEFSERTLSITNSLGYRTVMWSFAYEDWDEDKQPDVEKAKKKIIDNVHNGEIMLLHATSKTNANILSDVIKEIKSMGYEFKSLDDFVRE